ncbi:uncharacterized protein LOC135848672 [Planococcus citri]|uniref:uncharacterized protein LOC135848672 n=1 Tax=Planococcus citri TaxID=170843 RepID=UPI0031F9FBA3
MVDFSYQSNGTCQDCWDLGPPPDTILTIPPPPMPTFFASSFINVGNRSNAPCPLLCDWTTGQGLEINEEFPFKGNLEENSWFLLTISSFTIILLLAMLLTLLILKFRQNQKMKSCLHKTTYNDRTYESILYPSMKDNHVLWATLTPKGKPQAVAVSSVPPPLPPRVSHVRSFENCAFADMDDYPTKYGRPRVSSPMRIENPNMPPLNFYPSFKRNHYPSLL